MIPPLFFLFFFFSLVEVFEYVGGVEKVMVSSFVVVQDGVMNTHDEETNRYFKGTGVRCILAPRYGASKMSWFKQKVRELKPSFRAVYR